MLAHEKGAMSTLLCAGSHHVTLYIPVPLHQLHLSSLVLEHVSVPLLLIFSPVPPFSLPGTPVGLTSD